MSRQIEDNELASKRPPDFPNLLPFYSFNCLEKYKKKIYISNFLIVLRFNFVFENNLLPDKSNFKSLETIES